MIISNDTPGIISGETPIKKNQIKQKSPSRTPGGILGETLWIPGENNEN